MTRQRRQAIEIPISPADAGSRIDRVLRKLLPGVPLSHINRMLRRGEVRLSGDKVKGSDRADAGDILTLALDPDDAAALRQAQAAAVSLNGRTAAELRARLSGKRSAAASSAGGRASLAVPVLPVLYEDEHVIALDKPSGIACHPGSGHPLERTVLGALLSLAGEGTATFRPSLVGRLDRDTSGVQLAGRSPEGLRGLEGLSRAHEITKTYLALVLGEKLPHCGRVELPLRDRGSGRARMEVVEGAAAEADDAIAALTEYRVLARGGGASLLQVEPATGRRHQIRAHLAHRGAPIAGDVRYGTAKSGPRRCPHHAGLTPFSRAGLRRLFLHCARASFSHPVTGVGITISSPLPRDLSAVLTKLGIVMPAPPLSGEQSWLCK